ncbi:hypothetical protein ACWKWU_09935 [Chitinophaga lutea]
MKHYFNTNKVLCLTALAIGAITVFFACKKDDKTGADEKRDTQTLAAAQREAEVNAVYEDAFFVAADANSREQILNGTSRTAAPGEAYSRCYGTITFDPVDLVTWPKNIELDFEGGCTEGNRTRKGKIKITVSKMFLTQGAIATVTFDGYSVNDIKVEGTQIITNLGTGFQYEVKGGKLTYPNGYVVEYSGTRTLEITAGKDTPFNILDDTYTLKGNATLKDSAVTAAIKIETALERQMQCANISKGIVSVVVNGYAAKLDYGNGECDNKAMLTVGDKSKEITLN